MITKIKLVDKTEYSATRAEVKAGRLEIDIVGKTAEEIQTIFKDNPDNLATIEVYIESGELFGVLENWMQYGGVVLNRETKTVILSQVKDSIEARVIKMESEQEVIRSAAEITALSFTDEQALTCKKLYKNWIDDSEGYEYNIDNPEDLRRNFNNGLWRLQKSHAKQEDWYPGKDPTLWQEIVEGHDGTMDDPIPVPESAATSGFEYEYGKYYTENNVVYLCKRGGVLNPEEMYGEKVTLYFMPSAQVGQYFEVVG